MLKRMSRDDRPALAVLIIATLLISGAIVAYHVFPEKGNDFKDHITFARQMLNGQFTIIHVMFQFLLIGLTSLIPSLSMEGAAWLIGMAYYTAITVILYTLFRSVTTNRVIAVLGSLALIIVEPITMLTWIDPNLYFGYIGINAIHNPTMLMVKPFALIIFSFALHILEGKAKFNGRNVVIGIVLVVLSLFAKPNFVLTVLPMLMFMFAYRLYRRETTGLSLLLIGLILPMIILLGLQYVLQFVLFPITGGSGLGISPFTTIFIWEPSLVYVILKFFMSILFPLAVVILYRNEARYNLGMVLGWLTFLSGAFQLYMLIELGPRAEHGNFWWSGQIGLFILFVYTTLFWVKVVRRDRRGWLTAALFALHLISGIVFVVGTFIYGEHAIW